jgi:hypothetical protein
LALLIVMPLFLLSVNGAITFNYQSRVSAIKVCDVITHLMLSPEFESEQLPVAKKRPKQFFSRRLFFSQLPGKLG